MHAHTTCVWCVYLVEILDGVWSWGRMSGLKGFLGYQKATPFQEDLRYGSHMPRTREQNNRHTPQTAGISGILSHQCHKNLGLQHLDFLRGIDGNKSNSTVLCFVLGSIITGTSWRSMQCEFENKVRCPNSVTCYVDGWWNCLWLFLPFQLFCIF